MLRTRTMIWVAIWFILFADFPSAISQTIERPTNCTEVTSSGRIFIGHDCGEFASVLISGRIVIRKPWSRANRASRAARIRAKREAGNLPPATSQPAPATAPSQGDESIPKRSILDLDVSGGSTRDADCEDFSSHKQAQEYFDAQGWSARNDPFELDGDEDGIACE